MKRQPKSTSPSTRHKLLEAGVALMRTRGFNGTTVDDICQAAGVTKGGFFHYFESKDDLATGALAAFDDARQEMYRQAPFRQVADPLERVFARLDFEREVIESSGKLKGCLAGMLAQEMAMSRKEFRGPCHDFFARRIADFTADLAAAKAIHGSHMNFDPEGVATFYVAAVQGSQILSKVSGNNQARLENLEHFRTYLRGLFGLNGRHEAKQRSRSSSKA